MTNVLLINWTKSRYFDILILFICILTGGLIMFSLIDIVDPYPKDELFQYICVRRYNESPLGILVFWLGHVWTDIFGFSILNLRILHSIEMIITMGITSGFLYVHIRNIRLAGVMFLLGCILLRVSNFYIYNWDTGSFIFDAITLCILISSLARPSYIKFFILGVSIALITLGRLPSGIFLPVAIIITCISLRNSSFRLTPAKASFLILLGWIMTMILLLWVILGNPIKYTQLFLEGNIVSGHSPIQDRAWLASRLAEVCLKTPDKWFAAVMVIILAVILPKIKNKLFSRSIMIIWLVYAALFAHWYTKNYVKSDLMLGMDAPLGFGLLLAVPVHNLFFKKQSISKTKILQLWTCGLLSLSIAFGSDAFTERITTSFILPIIVGLLWPLRNTQFHNFLKQFITIALITFSVILISHQLTLVKFTQNYVKMTIYPFQQLKIEKSHLDYWEDARNATLIVRKKGIPYVYVGNHLLMELMTGKNEGPSFQEFHTYINNPQGWLNFREAKLQNIDAVIYSNRYSDLTLEDLLNDIKRFGFTRINKLGDAVIIYREPRLNKDKSYTLITD